MRIQSLGLSICAMAGLAQSVCAQTTFNEMEPNDSKAAANAVVLLAPGDLIVGNTMGSSTSTAGATSADYFRVKAPAAAPGIYVNRLVVSTATPGHTATLRGLSQSGSVINTSADSTAQTSSTSTPARMVQWYGFGRQEEVYVRLAGSSGTTADYAATYEREPVAAVDAGSFAQGSISIARAAGNTMDADFWVYDANLNAVPDLGSDTANAVSGTFTPGVYYIAWTNWNFANSLPAPVGDYQGIVLDFPDVAMDSSSTLITNAGIEIADGNGPQVLPLSKTAAYEVIWVKMTVTSATVPTGSCCMMDGTCSDLTQFQCTQAGGVFGGAATACATTTCPQPYMEVGDAGELPGDAQVVAGSGALLGISGMLEGSTAVDLYKIRVTDFANFSASTVGSTSWDTQLFLFDANGLGVATNDDVVGGTALQSQITSQFLTGNGEYYIGISRFNRDPVSGGVNEIFTVTTSRSEVPANGPGAGAPLDAWVNSVTASAGAYVIQLTGSEYIGGTPCYANCDASTTAPVLNVADFTCFLQKFAAGDSYANCDNSTTAPALNVADFTCFLQSFAAGCP